MKKFWTILLVLPLLFFITACGDPEMEGKIVIDFWHMSPVGSPSFTPMKQIINHYNNQSDKYYVRATGFSFWDYWDKLNIAISSRTTPDVGLSTIDDVVARASGNVLYNISELIEADTSDNNIDLNEFRQSQLDFATYNGDLYALPFSATARVLYYNLDMFAEKGLDEDDVPTTWEELHTIAKMFDEVDDKGDLVRIGFDPTYGNATYHGWLWQKGLDFFDHETLLPTLNTQGHIDVLNWIKDFNGDIQRSKLQAFGEGNSLLGIDPFAAERVAMIVNDDGLYQKIKDAGADFNYGVAPIPLPDENGVRVNWGSGFSIELYDDGKGDMKQKEAAFDFLKYLMSKDVQKDLAAANGWMMSHITAMQEYVGDDPILNAILAEVDYARDKVYIPYAPSWHGNDWQPFYNQALNGDLTAQEALTQARNYYLQKKANYDATR